MEGDGGGGGKDEVTKEMDVTSAAVLSLGVSARSLLGFGVGGSWDAEEDEEDRRRGEARSD